MCSRNSIACISRLRSIGKSLMMVRSIVATRPRTMTLKLKIGVVKLSKIGCSKLTRIIACNHTVTLSHIHSGYSCSEQPVQAPNQEYWCFLATPKGPRMQMQRSSFAHTRAIRAYCQLYYCACNS